MAEKVVSCKGVGIGLACRAFGISETCYRYQPKLSDENAEIADWLIRLTHNQRNWGFGLCFLYLRNRDRKKPRGPSLPQHRTYGSRIRRFDGQQFCRASS